MADISRRSLVLSFLGICTLHLVASLDATALSVALPTLANDLNATTVQAYWAGTGFVLGSAVLQPVFTAISHAFGRRPVVLLALGLFAIGTIVCGSAPNIAALLSGRAVQGAGCGGMLAMSQVVIADLFALQQRALAIALVGMVWLVGTSSGPVMGGGFTSAASWRWIFWFCLPFVGIGLVLIAAFLRTPHRASPERMRALKNFDWVGAIVFIAAMTSLLMGITWGGTMFAWSSYQTIVPLVVGGVGLVAFAIWERLHSKPMLALAVFKFRTATAAFFGQFLMGIVQFAVIYFLPLYYEVAKGYSPLIAGVALIPNCFFAGLSTALSGKYISTTGHYRSVVWVGWILLALGNGLLVILDKNTNIPSWIFINIVSGMGIGCLFSSLSMTAMAPQRPADQATAAALCTFFRTAGNAFGIAIGNAVYQNVVKQQLQSSTSASPMLRAQADAISRNAEEMRAIIRAFPSSSPARVELTDAFMHAIRALWWTLMGVALAGAVLSLLMRHYSLGGSGDSAAATGDKDSATMRSQGKATTVATTSQEDGLERGDGDGAFGSDGACDWDEGEHKGSIPTSDEASEESKESVS